MAEAKNAAPHKSTVTVTEQIAALENASLCDAMHTAGSAGCRDCARRLERQAALLDRMEPRRKYKFVELHALAGNPKQDQTRNDIARLMMIGALRTERVYHANATATYWRK